jgi:uncharacterized membrane protein
MKIITKETAPAIVLIGFLLWSIVAYFFYEISIPVYMAVSFLLLTFGSLWYMFGLLNTRKRRFRGEDSVV